MNKNSILFILFAFAINFSFAQDEVFTVVESMPVLSDSCISDDSQEEQRCNLESIQNYVASIDYPSFLSDKNIEGKVYISFVIAQDGSIINVELLRGTFYMLDEIALNHIAKMPKFHKPGIQRGKPVKVKYNIPINFRITGKAKSPNKKELKRLKKDWKVYKEKFLK